MSQIVIATFDAEGRKTSEITADAASAFRIGVRDAMIESGSATMPVISAFAGIDVAAPARTAIVPAPAAVAPSEPPSVPKRKPGKRARR